MNIDEMQAGREMDHLIKWHLFTANKSMGYDYWKENTQSFIPKYSVEIAAAWEVIEKLRNTPCKDGDHFCFDLYALNDWVAVFRHHLRIEANADEWEKEFEWFAAAADTAPLAICRAALKVMEARP